MQAKEKKPGIIGNPSTIAKTPSMIVENRQDARIREQLFGQFLAQFLLRRWRGVTQDTGGGGSNQRRNFAKPGRHRWTAA